MSTVDSRLIEGAHVNVFAALGDVTRLGLIATLCDGQSRSIVQLTDGFSLTRQAVTKHLRILEQAGIVRRDRVGRESQYAYRPEAITDASAYLNNVSEQWDDALRRRRAGWEC